jgi:hypothetical protein
MRKLGWIALMALACACGDNDHKKSPDSGAPPDDGRGSGAGCGLEVGSYPGYQDARVWNEADLAACNALCPSLQPVECLQANCPGAPEFFTCLDEQLYACQTSPNQDCRLEYEDWNCCAFESCDNTPDSQLRSCLMENCSIENSTVEECYVSDTASPGFVQCRDAAYESCLVPIDCIPADANPLGGYTDARTWTKAWTAAEYTACMANCKGDLSPTACINSRCPGAAEYRTCVNEETATCSTQPAGECRGDWDSVFCCARTNCAGAATTAQLQVCLETVCTKEVAAFNACDVASREGTCKATAEAACAVAMPDAGTPMDSGADPMEDAGPDASSLAPTSNALLRVLPAGKARAPRPESRFWTQAAERLASPPPSRFRP